MQKKMSEVLNYLIRNEIIADKNIKEYKCSIV